MKSLYAFQGKQGVDEKPAIKNFLHLLIEESFELMQDEREGYPYDFKSACKELEYKSRDGFIPNSYNHGGYSVSIYETIDIITGSGNFPASKKASKEINNAESWNRKFALEELGVKDESVLETDQALNEKVYDKASEIGAEDTIMFQISIMYHGTERGIHSATVQVIVNWEFPYHRAGSANEDFIETEVTWKTNRAGRVKILKAVKNGIKKLF